jgi:hypothetical protein
LGGFGFGSGSGSGIGGIGGIVPKIFKVTPVVETRVEELPPPATLPFGPEPANEVELVSWARNEVDVPLTLRFNVPLGIKPPLMVSCSATDTSVNNWSNIVFISAY